MVQFTNPGVQTIDFNISNHTQIVNNQATTNMRVSIQVIPPGNQTTVPQQQQAQQPVNVQSSSTGQQSSSSPQSDQQSVGGSSSVNTLRHRNVNNRQT